MANSIATGVAYQDQDTVNSNLAYVNSATGQFGYNTGSSTAIPSAVTQATSKSTGVTINAPTGTITTSNTSMLTTVASSFVVTNSSCGAYDVPVVAIKSGGTSSSYSIDVSAVAAGSFTITIQNISAGTLAEVLVVSFAIVHVAQQ